MASHGWWVSVMGPSLSSDQAPQRLPYKKIQKKKCDFSLDLQFFIFFSKSGIAGMALLKSWDMVYQKVIFF